MSNDYWGAAKGRLTTSLALTQQGVELILKGRIAAVSPFLLLTDPGKWPAIAKSFAQYRTVDSQDLITLHNSVSSEKLSDDFQRRFNSLRNTRNRVFHSVDKNLTITAVEVLEAILSFHKTFFPEQMWPKKRADFVEGAPEAQLDYDHWTRSAICHEFGVVMKLLPRPAVKKYFGLDKSKALYMCPKCYDHINSDEERIFKTAQLNEPSKTATTLFCPICNESHEVIREKCSSCKSNVRSNDERCLSCGTWAD